MNEAKISGRPSRFVLDSCQMGHQAANNVKAAARTGLSDLTERLVNPLARH